jgi:hypothetical protein
MRIQDALSNCCEAIREFTASSMVWIGQTGSALYATAAETMSKVTEFVRPHFHNLSTLAYEHRVPILIATVAFALGAAISAFVTTVLCRDPGHARSSTAATTV